LQSSGEEPNKLFVGKFMVICKQALLKMIDAHCILDGSFDIPNVPPRSREDAADMT